MTQKLIVVLATAYLIIEYGLQTSKVILAKRNREMMGYAKYFLYYLILALLLAVN